MPKPSASHPEPVGDDPPRAPVTRRRWLLASAAASALPITSAATAAAAALGAGEYPSFPEGSADAPVPASEATAWSWFTQAEAAFMTAALARLIPSDDLGPGAVEAGVATFVDRQLAGPYGRAERWYMQGPWGPGEPTQGYQTRLTPAGMYRAAIRAIDDAVSHGGRARSFAQLSGPDQDAFLHQLEKGEAALEGVDAKSFFAQLWQNTLEGFWSDPLYGGNREMAGWKLIGFPGARYDQSAYVSEHGAPYPLPPVGIRGRADAGRR
jgi:gluconate 2-dehydrogenase gamma chain